MGCASTLSQSPPSTKYKPAKRFVSCDNGADIPEDYPWSIPGYHDTVSTRSAQFSITQVRGEPNQFTSCIDCPCPTSKSKAQANLPVGEEKAVRNQRKAVIHFDHASVKIDAKQQAMLWRLYQSLSERSQLTITGYTDDTAPGGIIENEVLARQRAQAVVDYLIALGLDPKRVTIKASPLCCYIASNDSDAGRALNRRAEILISSSLSTQR